MPCSSVHFKKRGIGWWLWYKVLSYGKLFCRLLNNLQKFNRGRRGIMEWITDEENLFGEHGLDSTYGFCGLRMCSDKSNCSGYLCIILLQ